MYSLTIITLLIHIAQTVYLGTHTYTMSGSSYPIYLSFVVIRGQTKTLNYQTSCPTLTVEYYNCCVQFAMFTHSTPGTKSSSTSFVIGTDFIKISSSSSGCFTSLSLVLEFDCATIDSSCDACNGYQSCTSCTTGLYASSSSPICKTCVATNCLDCLGYDTCASCASGYVFNSATQCVTCDIVMPNCQSCTNNATCTSCASTSYAIDSSNKCVLCTTLPGMAFCPTCSNNNTCLTCTNLLYALDASSKCVTCSSLPGMANCQTCSSSGTCTACTSAQYALTAASKCAACSSFAGMANCQTCSGDSTCTQCTSTNHAVDANAKCALCASFAGMDNCQTCSNSNTCTGCSSSAYALDAAAKCALCSSFPLMTKCQTCSNNNTCTSCSPATYAVDASAKCSLCSTFPLMANCQICTNKNTCTGCSPSTFAVDATAKCSLCPTFPLMANCLTCTNNNTCTGCSSMNYALTAAAKCTLCANFVLMANCQTCSDNTTCTGCSSTNYAIDANQKCSVCSSFPLMANCQTCSNNNTCTGCSSVNYAVTALAKCDVCSSFPLMSNCQTCSNNSTCTSCSSQNYALSASAKCALCQTFALMSNCQTCTNNSTCTSCSSTFYVVNANNKCQICAIPLDHCLTCSSRTLCTGCVTGYMLDSLKVCRTCRIFMDNCVTCSSSTTCLTCDAGYAIEAAKCKACSLMFSNCNLCTSHVCTNCDSSFAVDLGVCKTCQTFMDHCSTCISQSTCTSCTYPYDVGPDQQCTKCQLPFYYASRFCIDDTNCVSAYVALNNIITCTFCNATKYYVMNQNRKCFCKKGFELVDSECKQICGDGKIFITECDDNNTNDFDGCSSKCKIENDFVCTENTKGGSKCKLNKNVVLKLDWVQKILSENKALILISLDSDNPNVHNYYRSILFDYNVTSNRTQTITILGRWMNAQGQIVIEIEYIQTIEDSMIELAFKYEKQNLISKDHMLKFQLKGKNYALVISDYIDRYQQIYTIEVYIIISFYVFVIVCLLSDKFIAVEGLNSFQMVYFSLLLIYQNQNWPQAFTTVLPLKYSMGFNQMIYQEKSFANIADPTFNKFRYLGMCQSFIMNNLTNAAILMVFSIVFLVLFIIKTRKQTINIQTKDKQLRQQIRNFFAKFRKIYKKLYNLTFHFSYIMIYQLFVSLYIETAYMKMISLPLKILSRFCGMWLFMTIVFTVLQNFNHFFLSYDDTMVERYRVGKVEARYKAVYLSYLLVNVFCIVQLNNRLFYGVSVSVVLLFLAVIYLVFLILYRPYRYSFTVHTFTIIASQIIYMITLGLITLVNFEIKIEEDYLLIFCYTLLGFCIGIALLTVVRVYLDFRFGVEQVEEEVRKEMKEIRDREKNAFVKQPLKKLMQGIMDDRNQSKNNPYTYQNQALVQEQTDYLNELMKKKFLSQWQRDQAYYRYYKAKPLNWVLQNEKRIKYEYLLQKETEEFQKNVYKQELKKKKQQKATDKVYTDELKNLKSKLRIDYLEKKKAKQKNKLHKKIKLKPLEDPQGLPIIQYFPKK